jgi:hypothetical protein
MGGCGARGKRRGGTNYWSEMEMEGGLDGAATTERVSRVESKVEVTKDRGRERARRRVNGWWAHDSRRVEGTQRRKKRVDRRRAWLSTGDGDGQVTGDGETRRRSTAKGEISQVVWAVFGLEPQSATGTHRDK